MDEQEDEHVDARDVVLVFVVVLVHPHVDPGAHADLGEDVYGNPDTEALGRGIMALRVADGT